MGDPPVRRQPTKPPPIPRPVAPASAGTDVGQGQAVDLLVDEMSEVTRNLEAPDGGELVARMLDLVASEAEALLVGDDADGRLADLNVRNALATWDGLEQPDEAVRYLELAEGHPLAARLSVSAAIASASREALLVAEARAAGRAGVLVDVAEAWLLRFHAPDRAAAALDRIDTVPDALREHVSLLGSLAHAAAGNWPAAVRARRAGLSPGTALDMVAATAALVLDRTPDALAALELCWDALRRADTDTQPSAATVRPGMLRLVDVALDAAMRAGDARQLELLERRAELVAALPRGALEALATRHALASALTRDGKHTEATALWTQLADDAASTSVAAARRIATLQATWTAAAAGDSKAALAAHRRLSDTDGAEVAASHAWRAHELAAADGASPAAIAELARGVAMGGAAAWGSRSARDAPRTRVRPHARWEAHRGDRAVDAAGR
jgi:hypothetical protein